MNDKYNEEMEQKILMIVSNAGAAKSKAFDALDAYECDKLDQAFKDLDEASKLLSIAHENQFSLMSAELQSDTPLLSIMLVHAMDICMLAENSIQYTKKLLSVLETQKNKRAAS